MWNDILDFVATLFGVLVLLIIVSMMLTFFGVIGYAFYYVAQWEATYIP